MGEAIELTERMLEMLNELVIQHKGRSIRASASFGITRLIVGDQTLDVVVAPELVGLYTAKNLGIEARASPFFVPGERSWIVVSGQSPAVRYADDIRAALKLIEREGIRENLVLKYLEQPLP